MTDQPELLTTIEGGVARITFNRPQARNALTQEMVLSMIEFLRECEQNDAVRVIVLTGAGDHFMAGGDVKGVTEFATLSPEERRSRFETLALDNLPLFSLMERIAKPIVAKVRGACAGVSVGYVAAADFVLASDTAMFVVANAALGINPDGAMTWHLPRVVGARKARQMCMLGERVTAQDALDIGLINWLHADDELDQATEKLVSRLASGPTTALGQTKHLLNASLGNSLTTQLELEARASGITGASDDFVEGLSSFAEKRKPEFKGH